MLYTSGTTGKPKGILHTTGGYSVGTYITTKWVFDLKDEDIYWCTADIGWVTGHSYIVYGPLQNGATSVMYEGAPNFPEPDRFWRIIDRHQVNIFYTAPTAIRAFMRVGRRMAAASTHKSLRLLGTVGEPINPEAWMWYREVIGHNRCPDRGHLVADGDRHDHDRAAAGRDATKPGSATRPLPGVVRRGGDTRGRSRPPGGRIPGDQKPWPAMLRPSTAIPTLQTAVLVADSRHVFHGRRRAQR